MRSFPVAFDQCRDLIHSLSVRCLPSATTADAAREVAESDDPTEAAIASVEAAQIYGLHVIAEDVGDRPAAFTRFVALGPYTRLDVQSRCRTAIAFVTDHRPGALVGALQPFARHGLNLVPARLAADPALDLPVPLRHGPRRPSARPRGADGARRDARVDARGADLRQLCRHGRPLTARTLFDRIWEPHVVDEQPGEPTLLYIDLHLVHEVTSPQAFEGLRLAGRKVRRPDLTIATMDHNVPTEPGPIRDPLAKAQLDALAATAPSSACR